MTVNVFSVPVFFVVFRESLETVVIVSVLLAFIKQSLGNSDQDAALRKKLVWQVISGALSGLVLCLIIGGGLIGAFYGIGKNAWSSTEYYWEASFAVVAAIIITLMGAALLRVSKMKEKWTVKLRQHLEPSEDGRKKRWYASWLDFKIWGEKHFMFVLPFITVLREGLEAVVFVAGVSFSTPAVSIPLPVVVGLMAGLAAGYLIYKGGATSKLQFFLVISTCLLYLVAAGLFSRAVWYFQAQDWNNATGGDAAETGAGPGSYDIRQSVWHVNFGNPELNGGGGWGIFNAILGWQNSATYGSVISYNLYWLVVILGFLAMRYKEVKGHLPFAPALKPYLAPVTAVKDNIANIKQRAIYKDGEVNLSDEQQHARNSSGTSSSMAKDPEKGMDIVTERPVHTISG
ncbi:high-affinity iron permease [Ciborinia camelliae]|nr:high-affinity iron permease [Ciborinia camelliae]